MKNLQKFLEHVNFMQELFKRPTYDINSLTAEQAEELFQRIECDLSPENISCDGEAPASEIRRRGKMLTGARQELESLGFTSNRF